MEGQFLIWEDGQPYAWLGNSGGGFMYWEDGQPAEENVLGGAGREHRLIGFGFQSAIEAWD